MGTGRHFAEYYIVALDEELYTENSIASQGIGYLSGYLCHE